jgi:hypothetical protein
MAKNPEDYGRAILNILQAQAGRAGDEVFVASLRQPFFAAHERRAADFDAGMAWLIEKGYLEASKQRDHYKLLRDANE